LRRWQPSFAVQLQPLLIANFDELRRWIPLHVAAPAPIAELEERLAGYAQSFADDHDWRFAIFTAEDDLIGEVSLFARSPIERVPLADADRFEIGYWLDVNAQGKGYATEATQALLDVVQSFDGVTRVEIRCDAANESSLAIPRRLGFLLDGPTDDGTLVWYSLELSPRG
jgi:RimJ/RimL family protein N-acetyltransferase